MEKKDAVVSDVFSRCTSRLSSINCVYAAVVLVAVNVVEGLEQSIETLKGF